MLTYCGRPPSASFRDPFAYIGAGYARETIAEICSMGGALATASISRTGSSPCVILPRCLTHQHPTKKELYEKNRPEETRPS
jgi:hypothetical protein